MNDNTNNEEIHVDVDRFSENGADVEAVALAMDLVFFVWKPAKAAFFYDEEKLADRLIALLPGRGYTATTLRERKSEVATFFTVLSDGRWVPSPLYFGLTDENPCHQ